MAVHGALTVLLRGTGVASAVTANLLRRSGLACITGQAPRTGVPAIMLSEPALALLRDIFGRPDLLAGLRPIERRMVRWGDGETVSVPHRAIVVSETALAGALGRDDTDETDAPGFTVHAVPPFPVGQIRHFGSRRAQAAPVSLHSAAEPHCCWVESGDEGWLFLIPLTEQDGWLLAIGNDAVAMLAQSRLVAGRIAAMGAPVAHFETAPRMLETLAGEDWLACGSAALGFDPICGDGTAQAAREGILAAAVIAGIARGEEPGPLLLHYRSMLLASMRRHLQLLLPFYATGGASDWWQAQEAAVRAGHHWCTERLGALPEPQFLLRGFDLVARELAA